MSAFAAFMRWRMPEKSVPPIWNDSLNTTLKAPGCSLIQRFTPST